MNSSTTDLIDPWRPAPEWLEPSNREYNRAKESLMDERSIDVEPSEAEIMEHLYWLRER